MDKKKLIVILQKALNAGIERPKLSPWIDPESYTARLLSSEIILKKEIQELLEVQLKSEPQLQLFNEKWMNSGYGATFVGINTLARWLILRSVEIGPNNAIEELERYLNLSATPGFEILAISGIEIDKPLKLSNKITLIPFFDLPDSVAKETLDHPMLRPARAASIGIPPEHFMAHRASVPKVALICKTEFAPKTMDSFVDREDSIYKDRSQKLLETCACLTLLGPSTPLPVALWTETEKWVPCAVFHASSWGPIMHDVLNAKNYVMKNRDRTRAKKNHEIFFQLPSQIREKLRVPLERLNQSIRRRNVADKAIDLGVAFEALLLNDHSHMEQIALAFRLRGAWLMGKSTQSRRDLLTFFNKLYDCRSKAVHTGKLSNSIKIGETHMPTYEFLERGATLCKKSIEEILKKGGFPEWDNLILGIHDKTRIQ